MRNARPVAERIRGGIELRPVPNRAVPIRLTVSVGISGLEAVPEEALFSTASLIERADRALASAASRGGNRVVVWSPEAVLAAAPSLEH
jgi:PleD family two-component response regulator